ncbi:MAG: phage gp6-like head-tail connector protein [Oscillospiraceae bacterium]|nr:phage gp6-like head-tail connector protein [Oscillospiraceae bacterium]
MTVSLDEVKTYLRIDYPDDDELLVGLISSAQELCASVARLPTEKFLSLESAEARLAVLYAAAYLNEHREEADHHALTLTLRALLSGIREAGF